MDNENRLDKLDRAGWNLFYAGGMRDLELYSATVGASKQIKEDYKKEKEEENQPQM